MNTSAQFAAAALTAALFASPPAAAEQPKAIILLAQASTEDATVVVVVDPIAQAEQEVEDARAVLRSAMAGNGNVRDARQALRRALQRLEQARENPDQPLPPLEVAEPETPVETLPAPIDSVVAAETELPAPESEQTIVEIQAPEGRIIVRQGGRLTVRHDDSQRLEQDGSQRQVQSSADGTTTTTLLRPNGSQVVTVRDRNSDILQRYRRTRDGRVVALIGDAGPRGGRQRQNNAPVIDLHRLLPRLIISIPEQDYIVESERASDRQLEQALTAPPVERVERSYSLREIRDNGRLRNKLRRIDIDTVNFEFGSATIAPNQVSRMQRIGDALSRILSRHPGEVFMIEGHTDAVGTDVANLGLSDRRAESVAQILTFYFAIPAENLITQGYGEQFLKIPTAAPERENRRVTLRRITPLLQGG